MLGTSAAVAVGAVAMASGMLGSSYDLDRGNDPAERVQAGDPPALQSQSAGEEPTRSSSAPASRDEDRSQSPVPEKEKPTTDRPSVKPSSPSETASSAPPTTEAPSPSRTTSQPPSSSSPAEEPEKSTKTPSQTTSKTPSATAVAEVEVLRLVNQERAKEGCSAVTNDPELAEMAGDYSEDMAARGFFDHTDPDGDDPWDRAGDYGITDLGGENIARGQADAQSVMDAWMQSEGHRANILNCEFKTMGVGAHFAAGGPWWTQNFGY